MSFQSVLNFFLSPFGIIILVGGFSTLGRVLKSAQEQQTKKRDLQDIRKAQRDSLRTGSSSSSTTQATASLQTQPTSKSTKQAAWDQKQQMRRDRIEQLRSQRVEQLKKLRQKRSDTPIPQSTARVQAPQARSPQSAPQRSVPPTPARSTHSHQHQHGPFPTAYNRPVAQPYAQPASPLAPQPTRRRQRPQVVAQQKQTAQDQARRVSQSKQVSPFAFDYAQTKKSTSTLGPRALFRQDMRRAIIAKEILGPPVGLRSPESTSM